MLTLFSFSSLTLNTSGDLIVSILDVDSSLPFLASDSTGALTALLPCSGGMKSLCAGDCLRLCLRLASKFSMSTSSITSLRTGVEECWVGVDLVSGGSETGVRFSCTTGEACRLRGTGDKSSFPL